MLLIGVGGGLLFMPLILTATSSVHADHAGIASGLVSPSQQLGGALGLAIIGGLAASRTGLLRRDHSYLSAQTAGLHLAFLVGAALAITSAAIGIALLPGTPEMLGRGLTSLESTTSQSADETHPQGSLSVDRVERLV